MFVDPLKGLVAEHREQQRFHKKNRQGGLRNKLPVASVQQVFHGLRCIIPETETGQLSPASVADLRGMQKRVARKDNKSREE